LISRVVAPLRGFRRRSLARVAAVVAAAFVVRGACTHSFCSPEISRAPGPLPLGDGDADGDGIPDALEDELAARFAPIVLLHRDDAHRPASIPWLLARANVFERRDQDTAVAAVADFAITGKPRIPEPVRSGSSNPQDWVAYTHVYPRSDGGTNIQYWFFYPFNDGPLLFDHDVDWEHLTVRLDASGAPTGVDFARHEDDHPGVFRPWHAVRREGDHPIALSARGTHATGGSRDDLAWFEQAADCPELERCDHPVWRTWLGGGLENIGERSAPLRHHEALLFERRWGNIGIVPGTSAPHGPLFHRGFCVDGFSSCLEADGAARTARAAIRP